MKDALGHDIKEGDYLVYPQRYSSHMWLTLAHVVRVAEKRIFVDRVELGRTSSRIKRTHTTMTQRAIVIPSESVPARYRSAIEGALREPIRGHEAQGLLPPK